MFMLHGELGGEKPFSSKSRHVLSWFQMQFYSGVGKKRRENGDLLGVAKPRLIELGGSPDGGNGIQGHKGDNPEAVRGYNERSAAVTPAPGMPAVGDGCIRNIAG